MASLPVWYGCDWPSGRIVAELPSLSASGPLSRRLGTFTTLSLSLDLGAQSPGWVAATQEGRALLVACIDDVPMWAGVVLPRDRGSARTASLTATTPEGYLARRYTPDLAFTGSDLSSIAAGVLATVQPTVPCLDIASTPTGMVDDRIYRDSDDKTVSAALGELMALDGGPEWTIDPVWAPSRTGFRLTARIAPRIGSVSAMPTAVFDFPGPVTVYAEKSSYESGQGATVVRATGAGEGDTRAVSATLTSPLVAAGWPVYEYRWSPGSDITDSSVLDSHAAAALALLQSGASTWSLTASVAEAPALGSEWQLGDAVRLLVQPGTSFGHPDGADVTARCWAWELDPAAGTVAPILVEGT
ncbi:hypothetical protein [Kitasatospora phosalacinea]|uniref:Minor tail protein n=1 Tax=Kitasatospora phosalacinea TaxID=2065 RepID=A0ABW6GRG4_9ACTN